MKIGDFSLEVINAHSKQPMKEHSAPDGKIYVGAFVGCTSSFAAAFFKIVLRHNSEIFHVNHFLTTVSLFLFFSISKEAEPDFEYFLRCKSDIGLRSPPTQIFATLDVDGTYLGYNSRFTTKSHDLGLWKYENGESSFVALKFVLKRTRAATTRPTPGMASIDAALPPVGKITAKFHEVVKGEGQVEIKDRDYTTKVPSSVDQSDSVDDFSAMATPTGKKAFASVAGSTVSGGSGVRNKRGEVKSEDNKPRFKQKYIKGRRLGEVSIHYTSALGFIHLGILSAPSSAPTSGSITNDNAAGTALGTSGGVSNTSNNQESAERELPDRKRIKTEKKMPPSSGGNKETIDLTLDD